jgi:hypothetical protein
MHLATDRDNPYTPPEARLADPDDEPGSPLKAVSIGLAVDFGGTFLTSFVLVFVYGVMLGASGTSAEAAASALANLSPYSWVSVAGFIAGSGFSVLGGYLCARIAKHSEYKLGGILATISTVIGLLFGMNRYSLFVNFILTIATFALVMIGVRIGYSKNRLSARRE